jgi:hypothetical protein
MQTQTHKGNAVWGKIDHAKEADLAVGSSHSSQRRVNGQFFALLSVLG